jgi:hypothetical protein
MTVHRYHPDASRDDPPDARLFDDCERCTEQAESLFGLDRQKLAWFWSAMHQFEREDKMPPVPFTSTERMAIRRMHHMAVIFERLAGVWPSPEVLLDLRGRIEENV